MNTETVLTLYELRSLTATEFNDMPEADRLATMQKYFEAKMSTRMAALFFINKTIFLAKEKGKIIYSTAIDQADEIRESIAAKGTDYVCYHQPLIGQWDN
ncbi:MAG: hypothetical protein J5I50_05175 [Chitinophagaceae bacterium]|nr:hypothetical protein [Chitinophagaceae bacterium]